MRYKDGEVLDSHLLTQHASHDMLVLTAVLGVFVGIALACMGKLGKQLWMLVWGIGLIAASLYMGIVTYYDLPALLFSTQV